MELILVSKDELQTLITDSLNACLNKRQPEEVEDLPEWLTRRQVAEYLNCTLATVDNYSRAGTLKKRYINGLPRFKREEVRQALEDVV